MAASDGFGVFDAAATWLQHARQRSTAHAKTLFIDQLRLKRISNPMILCGGPSTDVIIDALR
jgi:hypothetical protein